MIQLFYTENKIKNILNDYEHMRKSYEKLTDDSLSLEYRQTLAREIKDRFLPVYRKKLSLDLRNDSRVQFPGKLEDECTRVLAGK